MVSSYSKIPVFILIGLLTLAVTGLYFDSHQNVRSLVCTSLKPKKHEPAAEILFIGSSVIGRSIGPSFISTRLSENLGRPISVEKLAPVRNYMPRMHALVRDYIKFRGSPEIVVLNLPYSNYGANAVADARMLWRIPYTSTEDSLLTAGQSIFKSQNLDLSIAELAFHRDGASYLRLQLEKLTAKIYGGLRYPILAATDQRPACPQHLMDEHSFILASSRTEGGVQPIPKTEAQLDKGNQRYLSTKNRPLADPTLKIREFESDQINAIINLLASGGSSVYITTIPRFNEYAISEDIVKKYSVAFEKADYLNLYSELSVEQMTLFQQSFMDGVHVDRHGAFVMSQFWVDRLEILVSD